MKTERPVAEWATVLEVDTSARNGRAAQAGTTVTMSIGWWPPDRTNRPSSRRRSQIKK